MAQSLPVPSNFREVAIYSQMAVLALVKALPLLGVGGNLYFCAVLVGTCKVRGCNSPKSKTLCHPPQGAAMLHVRICTRNTVALLAVWFSSSHVLTCVQAQVTQKSDDSTESQSLLNYYMQKGFRVLRMGERRRMWSQISLCCNTCSMGWSKWIPFALFPKSTLIAVVIIPTFAPQDFVRIYSLTLQVVLNAEKSYGEEILQCRLGGQIYLNRLLWLRHFINVPRTNTTLCMYVRVCACVYGKLRELRGNQHYSSFSLAEKLPHKKWELQNYFI